MSLLRGINTHISPALVAWVNCKYSRIRIQATENFTSLVSVEGRFIIIVME